MIFNPIKQLKSAGIKEILIITSMNHMGEIVRLLGSGKDFGCDFTFKVQEEAKGVAHALYLAKAFAEGGKIAVILGDNIATHSIKPFVEEYEQQKRGAKVLLRKVSDPERYGIAALDEKKVIEIEEKPKQPKSSYAVVGIYMYDADVFRLIEGIEPSARGEYEITAVNNIYIDKGELTYNILEGDWTDAGTFASFRYANKILTKTNNRIIE